MIIGEPMPKSLRQIKEIPVKRFPEASSKGSAPGGHEKQKSAGSAQTGQSGSSGINSKNVKKKRPSFKELLAKYEEKGATQK